MSKKTRKKVFSGIEGRPMELFITRIAGFKQYLADDYTDDLKHNGFLSHVRPRAILAFLGSMKPISM